MKASVWGAATEENVTDIFIPAGPELAELYADTGGTGRKITNGDLVWVNRFRAPPSGVRVVKGYDKKP
jgi:hypothetical protein